MPLARPSPYYTALHAAPLSEKLTQGEASDLSEGNRCELQFQRKGCVRHGSS